MSRVNVSTAESGAEIAIGALRAHISASGEIDHGPKNEFPDDIDRETLAEHVTKEPAEDSDAADPQVPGSVE